MQGERRVVTMLFCDVEGSTAAAESLDPEEWAEIMNGAFEHLIAPVYRYEGTLARLMGDAILAFFGAPIAHEDDPQRAVLAGLDILEAIEPYRDQVKRQWDLDFNVRVGINTGLVVVGEVGSDLRVEYTALGDAVNLASRMEQAAEAGTVQITEDTYRQVAPLFETEDLGGIEVKGKSEPVLAYRVLGTKAQPGQLRGIEGLDAPLIGRDDEMSVLRGAVAELTEGNGQLVSVMGEAGLGKSRLVAELHHALVAEDLVPASRNGSSPSTDGASPEAMTWMEGRSLSYQTSTPYAPFVDLLGSFFDLPEDAADAERYAKIKGRVSDVLPDRASEIAPFLATMLGVPIDGEDVERVKYLNPPQVREQVFRATCDLLEGLASVRPLIVAVEDVHWIDPTSLDLLQELMAVTDRAALMIIGLFRPWTQEPSWRFHEVASRDYTHRYNSVTLQPLDPDNSRELVANLLHVEDLPEKVRALILEKAEGNPFFVEEVIRSLLDAQLVVRVNSHWRATREIVNIAVPDTLAGVITARLDRLDDRSKRLAQTASVIGREFLFDALVEVHDSGDQLEAALTDLQRRELIREKSRVPRRVYTFKHAMTQETAYASLLLSRRRDLHRNVAEVLERTDAERVAEIARHYVEAREQARALPYLLDAGDQAARAYATQEAIQAYEQALEIIETVQDVPLARRAYEGLGGALTFIFDVEAATDNYQKMERFGVELGDMPMQVSARNKLGFVTGIFQGQLEEADEMLTDAARLAHECEDLPGLAEMHMTYCYLRTTTGDFEDAVDHLQESAKIGQELDLEEPRLFGMIHTANTLTYMTQFDDAWEAAQEAKKMAEHYGNRQYLSELGVFTIPLYHLRNGDLDAAVMSAEEGTTQATQIGAADSEGFGAFLVGLVASLRGQYERAIEWQERALEAGQASGYNFLQATALCALGTAHLDINPKLADVTLEYHMRALQLTEAPMGTFMGALNWAEVGFCALTTGDLKMATELFEKGLTISTAPKYLARPMLLVGSALVAMENGNLKESGKLVQEGLEFAEERKMKHTYPMLGLAGGRISTAEGDPKQALERFERGERSAAEMGMLPMLWQCRAGAAQALGSLGRTDEAEAKLGQAQETVDELAGLFEDEKLRDLFIENAESKLAESKVAADGARIHT